MSDDVLIKSILDKNKSRYGSGLDDSEAFEYFCAEAILKEADIEAEFKHIKKLFDKEGAEDKVAKDQAFTTTLKKKSLVKESKAAAQKTAKPKS